MKSLRMGQESRSALEAARAQGLNVPDKPADEMPEGLPSDLTALDDMELMRLYTELTGWAGYIGVQQSFAQTDERRIKRRLEFVETKALIQAKAQAAKITDARLLVKDDPAIQEIHEKAASAEAYRKLIEALFVNCERDAGLVSRELTRRTSSPDRGRRERFDT